MLMQPPGLQPISSTGTETPWIESDNRVTLQAY
jgi:hypothetical protein